MKQNKLLERQIKKLLPETLAAHPDLQKLLQAVNESYQAYERDNELAARAFAISEEEYIEINQQLKQEVHIREQALAQLIETAGLVTGATSNENSGDLLKVAGYLKQQVALRKNAEKVFTSLITNLQSGVLLENEDRKIVFCNQLFTNMFGIPVPPENLIGADCSNSAEQSKGLFAEPAHFVQRITELLQQQQLVSGEELQLVDGRVFERDFIPIHVDQVYAGHLWVYTDITERKKALEALAKSELTNRLILNASLDGIVMINGQGRITYWNPQAEQIFGWREQEVLGKPLSQTIIPEAYRSLHEKGMQHFRATGQGPVLNQVLELTAIDRHNREFAVEISIVPIQKDNETVFCGFIRNIAERKKAENELKRLSLVASANINGVLFIQPNGTMQWANEQFFALTGYSKEDALGKAPIQLLKGPQSARATMAYLSAAFGNGEVFKQEVVCYRKDKTSFWGEVSGQPVLDDNGKVVQYFAVLRNITAEKETQQKMAEFEQRFRKVLERIGDNVWEYDFNTGKTFFSNISDKLLGPSFSSSDDLGKLWWGRTHPDDRGLLEESDAMYKTGQADHHMLEYRVLQDDGAIRWVLDRGVLLEKTNDGQPLRIMGTHTDITEMKLAEQALRINEEKYRNIIANMNLGMMEVDLEEKVQYVNQSFCEISGYTQEELLGKRAMDIFVQGENREKVDGRNELRKNGVSDAYEVAVKDKRGNLRWWFISGAPRYNDNGDLVGSVGIHLDITEQKELEHDLILARRQAEESSKAKELFLANMSHEIRTPMNAILGMARQLQKTDLAGQQSFYLDTILKAGEHLLVILNDILDISKIEAGALQLEQIGFALETVLQQTVQVMRHRAQEKGILLNYTLPTDIPALLKGDPYRLKQVLLNLVSNAVKFTEKGSVQIQCTIKEGLPHRQICIAVSDTGIGMEADFAKRVFQKFLQEDKSTTRKFGGTGLGMSISKQLIELMGGSIHLQSEKNKGTVVTIVFPLITASANDLPPKAGSMADRALLEQKEILLAEDNEMNRLVASTILQQYGAVITEVVNGSEAVDALKARAYDLVLMDIQMPVMDGLKATSIIRQELHNTVPIIALTANAIKGENQKCIDAGMNDYLSKPFEEEALIQKIAICLGGQVRPNDPVRVEQAEGALYSLSTLAEIARGNDGFIEKMVQLFIEQSTESVAALKLALANKQHTPLKEIAHRIKPSIDNMQIVALKTTIRQLEQSAGQQASFETLEPLVLEVESVLDKVVAQLQANHLAKDKNTS